LKMLLETFWRMIIKKPLIGVSSCLLGREVRYEGQHEWDRFLTDTLGRSVDYLSQHTLELKLRNHA